MPTRHILVVCTGNICRSPMAEALLRAAIGGDPHLRARGIEVRSAGTHGWDASPSTALIVEVMRDRGVDLGGHRSQSLSEALVEWADLILTMTAAQVGWILQVFPKAEGKVMRVSEYSGTEGDVEDPYGGDREEYARCADFLAALVPGILAHLNASSEERQ